MRHLKASGPSAGSAHKARRGHLFGQQIDAEAYPSSSPKLQARSAPRSSGALPVYDGRTCIGRILSRGIAGFEAITENGSLGLFKSQGDAANAIADHAVDHWQHISQPVARTLARIDLRRRGGGQ